jgi:GDP-L-fucose synthase
MALKLFLTGGTGMVGRNVLAHPAATDWDIAAPGSAELDLMDADAVVDFVAGFQPDVIVHAAGKVGGIRANIAAPVEFLDRNTAIGRNVIMAAYTQKVKKLINLGSTCIYPRNGANPLREEQILTGELEPTNEGYALAKILALRLCEYIRREAPEYQYKTIIPCNLYGPFDKFDPQNSHLIPAIIHKVHLAMTSGDPEVEIWGNGEARREFMFAPDLAGLIFKAANDIEAMPDLLNAGVGTDHSINEFYQIVAQNVGLEAKFVHDLSKPTGMAQKLCDTTRQSDWGWQPQTSLSDGIAKTYQYYLENFAS